MIEFHWYDENKTILVMVFAGAWTIQQLEQTLSQIGDLLCMTMHRVAIMIELASAMAIPPSGFITSLKKMVLLHQDCDVSKVIHVAPYPESLVLWRELIQTLPIDQTRYHFVDNHQQALDIIHT